MRILVAATLITIAMAVPAASCASGTADSSPGTTPDTELVISFWPDGRQEGNVRRSTLRCGPAGGTVRSPAATCRRLAATRTPFAPIPKDAICTQIYGGPSEALVRGRYRGNRVWTIFRRTDGCNIARWERVRFLLPAPLASSGS